MRISKVNYRLAFTMSFLFLMFVTDKSYLLAQNEQWMIFDQNNSPIPSYGVEDVDIDLRNNIWITVLDGLYKFNGIEWTVYTSENSELPSSLVYVVEIDGGNNVWIGTEEGLVKLNNDIWEIYTTENSQMPLYNCVHHLAAAPDNKIWLTTNQPIYFSSILGGSGLTGFDGENWTVYDTLNSDLPNNYISFLETDDEGNVWMGTGLHGHYAAGLVKYDGNSWTVYNTDNSGLPSNIINSIAFDDENNIWIGTNSESESRDLPFADGGLAKFDGTNWEVFTVWNSPLTSNNITALLFNENNDLWIGTRPALLRDTDTNTTGGLYFYDGENWQMFTRDNSLLPSNSINALTLDAEGNLWIGYSGESVGEGQTSSGGVAIYNPDGIVLNVEKESGVPQDYLLLSNYPNPFNPSTIIRYTLSQSGNAKLTIYNLLGEKVITLEDEYRKTGTYEIKWNAERSTGGIYFCRLEQGNVYRVIKLVLIK